jgi:hypothetical protein
VIVRARKPFRKVGQFEHAYEMTDYVTKLWFLALRERYLEVHHAAMITRWVW